MCSIRGFKHSEEVLKIGNTSNLNIKQMMRQWDSKLDVFTYNACLSIIYQKRNICAQEHHLGAVLERYMKVSIDKVHKLATGRRGTVRRAIITRYRCSRARPLASLQ